MKNYKVAIIGAGAVAGLHAAAIKAVDCAGLVAIVDVLPEKAEAFGALHGCKPYSDLEEMLDAEKPDVAILAIPTFLHCEYVERCGLKGVHVLCEKPIEMNLDQARKLIDNAKKYNIGLMIGQVVRFMQAYVKVKEMYDNGELGDVMMAYLHRSSTVPARGGWIIDPNLGRGSIQDMHIHDVDFLEYMFGQAKTVYAHAIRDYTGCFNQSFSSFTFPNGTKGVAECSFANKNSYPFTMSYRIGGTKATVEFYYRASVTDTKAVQNKSMVIFKDNEPPVTIGLNDEDAYALQLEYFLNCIETGKEPEIVPYIDNLRSIAMLDAVRESAETEKVVEVVQI